MRQESEDSQTVVDADHNYTLGCQRFAVVRGLRTGADHEPTAVDPHHHGQFLRNGSGWRPNVQPQAILALWTGDEWDLRAHGRESFSDSDPFPGLGRLRGFPTEVAHRWCGEGDAFVGTDGGSAAG